MYLVQGHNRDRPQDLSIRSPMLYHYATTHPLHLFVVLVVYNLGFRVEFGSEFAQDPKLFFNLLNFSI